MISPPVFLIGILISLAQCFLLYRVFLKVPQPQYRMLFSFLGIHLVVALTSQFFGVFNYEVVVSGHVAVLTILWLYCRFTPYTKVPNRAHRLLFREWGLLTLVVVVPVALSMVYFNYSGEYNVTTNSNFYEAEQLSYPFPSVSDEWYAIGWIEQTIETQSLPLSNLYDENDQTFVNYQLPFHSLLSSVFLLFGIDPLEGYVAVSIFLNSVLVLFLYSVMRSFGAKQGSAVLAASVGLTIPWGASLLGLWCLIPATFGYITLLALIGEGAHQDKWSAYTVPFGVFLCMLLYPPFAILLLPIAVTMLFVLPKERRSIYGMSVVVVGVALLLVTLSHPESISRLWYQSLLGNAIPVFVPHQLLPFLYIILAYVMLIPFKKKFLPIIVPWAMGLVLWVFYAVSTLRVVVGYERVVVVVLFLTLVLASLGLTRLIGLFSPQIQRFVMYGINMVALLSVALTLIGYTEHDNWKHIVAVDASSRRMFLPGAPVVLAFFPEDKEVFERLEKERFLSTPWKGTVVGTVTNNVPMVTQPGTVTMHPELYKSFVSADCEKKKEIARTYTFSFTYTTPFVCDGFSDIVKTSEGYVLKKFIDTQ